MAFTNFDSSDEDKVQRAVELIRQVVKTEEFRTRVLNHKYNGVKSFASTSKTNAQVYQALLNGAETLKPEVDHEMDLQLSSTPTTAITCRLYLPERIEDLDEHQVLQPIRALRSGA